MSNLKDTLDKFGKFVVQQSKSNLTKKDKKDTSALYNSMDYDVKVSAKGNFEFTFFMEEYGDYVDKGVRGAGGVRKTTSQFKSTNNKGKLWKIKGKNSIYKFGKSGGISPKHFEDWAKRKGLSPFAVAKSVYHQGLETTNFFTRPFELAFAKLPDEILKAFDLDIDKLLSSTRKNNRI